MFKFKSGFTLLELVLVISILSILFGFVIFNINPVKRINLAYNAQRENDVNTIEKAIQQYYIDNSSYDNLNIPNQPLEICDTGYTENYLEKIPCENSIDLSVLVPKYLVAIPTDPLNIIERKNDTLQTKFVGNGYLISVENNQIIVNAKNYYNSDVNIAPENRIDINNVRLQVVILSIAIILCTALAGFFIVRKNRE